MMPQNSHCFQSFEQASRWCAGRFDPKEPKFSLRSEELRVRDDMYCGFSKGGDAILVLEELIKKRRSILNSSSMSIQSSSRNILVFCPESSTDDGLAEVETKGLFDDHGCPPWDTWFWYSPQDLACLFCYIPDNAMDIAIAGARNSMQDCLFWLNDLNDFVYRGSVKIPEEIQELSAVRH